MPWTIRCRRLGLISSFSPMRSPCQPISTVPPQGLIATGPSPRSACNSVAPPSPRCRPPCSMPGRPKSLAKRRGTTSTSAIPRSPSPTTRRSRPAAGCGWSGAMNSTPPGLTRPLGFLKPATAANMGFPAGATTSCNGICPIAPASKTATWSSPPGAKRKTASNTPRRESTPGAASRCATAASRRASACLPARAFGPRSGCCHRKTPTAAGPPRGRSTSWKRSISAAAAATRCTARSTTAAPGPTTAPRPTGTRSVATSPKTSTSTRSNGTSAKCAGT